MTLGHASFVENAIIKNILPAVFALTATLTLSLSAFAQTTVIYRVDSFRGVEKPVKSVGVVAGKLEVWAFGYNDRLTQDFEVGTTVPIVKDKVFASGYLAVLPDANQFYAVAAVAAQEKVGRFKVGADLTHNFPLGNKGTHSTIVNASVVSKVVKNVDAGISASSFWAESGPRPVRFGPTLRVARGNVAFKVDYQPFVVNGTAPAKLRCQVTTSF